MTKTFLATSKPQRTHPIWWCMAVICSILTIGVIFAGIVVFVGYLVIHPRIPVISVVDAHLNLFQYDLAGVLETQVSIMVRSENDNQKAHASFSDMKLTLFFDGIEIAWLRADPYDVMKNDSTYFPYVVTSQSIALNPRQMQDVDAFLNQDQVKFDLKGTTRARWRVGLLGSVRFWLHLDCTLRFRISDGTYFPSTCTSRAK